jgi:hypothetical protein
MHPLIQIVDQYLIMCYRLTGHAGLDFAIGTFVLAGLCLLMGKFTVFLAYWFTRKRLEQRAAEASKYQDLAITALKAGNKEAYAAANTLANEAFGHSFFQQAALSAGFLWPVCFALGWMQYRFLEVEFPIPGTNWSLGFMGGFIPIYIAAYLIMKRLPRLRRFKRPLTNDALQAPNQEAACRSSAP